MQTVSKTLQNLQKTREKVTKDEVISTRYTRRLSVDSKRLSQKLGLTLACHRGNSEPTDSYKAPN